MKKTLYIYDNASPHVHDSSERYKGCVPLSESGISKHFTVVNNPDSADYLYVGQIREDSNVPLFKSDGSEFEFLKGNEHRHIADMEGEGGWDIPEWLQKCILTTMGPRKEFDVYKLFTRPTFSTMMVDMMGDHRTFDFPEKNGLGFRGCINHKSRETMFHALDMPVLDEKRIRREAYVNSGWAGSIPSGHQIHTIYEELMLRHPISLCPRGAGIDTTRIIETCFYNRVPVMITDKDFHLVGEDTHDVDFCFRIVGDISPEDMANELVKVYNTDIDELKERGKAARKYFDTVIRKYFEDPTLYFMNWLKESNDRTK